MKIIFFNIYLCFPGGSECKLICLQFRRPRFNPWVKIPQIRKWQPTPVLLPGESHGQRSLADYSPWGRRVRHDWATNTHIYLAMPGLSWGIKDHWFLLQHVRFLAEACEIQFPDQGSNPGPLHRECGVLPTGPPGNSPEFYLLMC